MMSEGMSAADYAAISNDGFGGGSSWFWIVVLFLFMFGGNGWGGNQQYATSSEVQSGFNNQNVMTRFDTLAQNQNQNALDNANLINQNKYDNAVLIKDAQYTNLQNTNALAASLNQNADAIVAGINSNSNAIVMSQTNGFNSVNTGINDLGYQVQTAACGINRNIDSVRYENAQNTCAITNAIHQESEITRGLIQANTIQSLRDRLEEKDRLYQAANFQISQAAQTSTILDSLGRWVANPPVPVAYPYYGTSYASSVIS